MNDRAKKETLRALASTKVAKKAKKGLEKKAKVTLRKLGINNKSRENISKLMAAAKVIKDRKITLKKKLGKNTSISGTADFKKKEYKVGLNHSF